MYHINDEQKVGRCSAEPGRCPFGGESEHFDTDLSAKAEVERRKASEAAQDGKVASRRKRQNKTQEPQEAQENAETEYVMPGVEVDDDPMYGGWVGVNAHYSYGRKLNAALKEELEKAKKGRALSKGFKAAVSSNYYSIKVKVGSIQESDGFEIQGTPYRSIDRLTYDAGYRGDALRSLVFDHRDGSSALHFSDISEKYPDSVAATDLYRAASIASSFTYNKNNIAIDYFNSGPRVEVYVPTDIEYSETAIKSATRKLDRLYEKIETGTATDRDKIRFKSLIETAKYHRDRKRFFERRNKIAEEDLDTDRHLYVTSISDTDLDRWNQAAWKEMVSNKDFSDSEFRDIIQRRYPQAVGIAGI